MYYDSSKSIKKIPIYFSYLCIKNFWNSHVKKYLKPWKAMELLKWSKKLEKLKSDD